VAEPIPGVPADIVRFLRAYVAAYGSGVLDELRPFYAEGSLIWPNQRGTVIGWAAVQAMFSPSFGNFAIDARVHLLEVREYGDESFLRFLTEVHLTPRGEGAPVTAAFRDFALLRRSGASWTIFRNIDQPITLEQLGADLEREAPRLVIGRDPHSPTEKPA
jgi:ketosteroid isomerase-like protein